jgi:hypothetical protein
MAKNKTEKYFPKEEEITAMKICFKNDLAYVIQPIKDSIKYNVVKFQISNNLELHILKENNINVQFTEYEASKKVMELYTQHSKRFSK